MFLYPENHTVDGSNKLLEVAHCMLTVPYYNELPENQCALSVYRSAMSSTMNVSPHTYLYIIKENNDINGTDFDHQIN